MTSPILTTFYFLLVPHVWFATLLVFAMARNRDDGRASLEEALAAAKAAYEASEQALKDATKSHAAAVEAQTKSAKASLAAAEASVVSERRRGEEELSKLREDHRKKSALARQLVAEKDEALTLVTAEADELRQEVESGGHNEKKIFALAQVLPLLYFVMFLFRSRDSVVVNHANVE